MVTCNRCKREYHINEFSDIKEHDKEYHPFPEYFQETKSRRILFCNICKINVNRRSWKKHHRKLHVYKEENSQKLNKWM